MVIASTMMKLSQINLSLFLSRNMNPNYFNRSLNLSDRNLVQINHYHLTHHFCGQATDFVNWFEAFNLSRHGYDLWDSGAWNIKSYVAGHTPRPHYHPPHLIILTQCTLDEGISLDWLWQSQTSVLVGHWILEIMKFLKFYDLAKVVKLPSKWVTLYLRVLLVYHFGHYQINLSPRFVLLYHFSFFQKSDFLFEN